MSDQLYDSDFVIWTERQASALREAKRAGVNLPSLRQEIERLVREEMPGAKRLVARSLAAHKDQAAELPGSYTEDQVLGDWFPPRPANVA